MSRLQKLTALYESDPRDADVAYMIAQEHAKAGAHDEAMRWYDACLELDGAYHYAYFHKARAQEDVGDEEGAIETLRTGLERARSDANAKAVSEIEGYLVGLGG